MTAKSTTKFDKWAPIYDRCALQTRYFEPLHELALSEARGEVSAPHAVLDLGCGTGRLLKRAAVAFPRAELVGVDVSAEMVKAAQAAASPDQHMRFIQAAAEALPLNDASFDLVLTTLSFHHWTDQQRGIAEVHRVLRPGGAFVLADIAVAGLLRCGALVWLFSRLDGGRFRRPEVLDAMLAEAGFRVVRRTPAPHFAKASQVTVAHRL